MAETPSTMVRLGTSMPEWTLQDPDGTTYTSGQFAGKPVVIVFMCNHCPFVKLIANELGEKAREYKKLGVEVVGIMSNDVATHEADSPENMKLFAAARGIDFPYLYDSTQEVAKAFRAACTPDFFLFDADHKLAYRGQFDSARPSRDVPVTGEDLTAAVEAVAAGRDLPAGQTPSIGCNIKWRSGNEPEYA